MITSGLVEDGGRQEVDWVILWKNLREISSLRLANEFKSAANSIDEYTASLERNLERFDITIRLGQVDIEPVDCVRDLGVLLDSSLSMRQHIARITSTCFFHLRRLRKLSRILDIDARKRLVCALIVTRVDYCNTALAVLPDSALAPLQRVLHAAARCVAATGSCHSGTADTELATGASAYHL